MRIHVAKCGDKLYQDGKEVKKIVYPGNIVDITIKENGVWIKFI